MGCNEDAATDPDKVCIGYELTANLDFDTDGDGDLDSSDDYWNNGDGFNAIGRYTAILDGNGNAIKNLRVRHSDATHLGLFGRLKGTVRDLGLAEVNISASSGNTVRHAGGVAGETGRGSPDWPGLLPATGGPGRLDPATAGGPTG